MIDPEILPNGMAHVVHLFSEHGEADPGPSPEHFHARLHDEDADLEHAVDDLTTPVLRAMAMTQEPGAGRYEWSQMAREFWESQPGLDLDLYVTSLSVAHPVYHHIVDGPIEPNALMIELANGWAAGFMAGVAYMQAQHFDARIRS